MIGMSYLAKPTVRFADGELEKGPSVTTPALSVQLGPKQDMMAKNAFPPFLQRLDDFGLPYYSGYWPAICRSYFGVPGREGSPKQMEVGERILSPERSQRCCGQYV
jgi:hypothetical protein